MASMNPVRDLHVLVRLNWRIIALCLLVAVVVAGLMRYDHNRGRFMLVPASGDYPPQVIDTRTGQYCDPLPKGIGRSVLPKCADLSKSWR
jgi:hypothetical protein